VNTAASLFESAARTGHAEANYNLGLLFLNGSGKPKNVHRAALHIGYAAEQGIAAAQYDYAGLVEQGVGVEQNAYEQARWLSKAAEQGLAAAQYEYAVMLLRGRGLKVDVPKAIVLLKDAARKGVAGAQNRLAHVYDQGVRVSPDPLQMAKWRFLAAEAGFDDAALDSKVAALPAETRLKAQQLAARFRDTALVAPLSLQ
ncbi:MAG: tetratricopeptide repeat protein, partial [Pseudomonadota bacterium]